MKQTDEAVARNLEEIERKSKEGHRRCKKRWQRRYGKWKRKRRKQVTEKGRNEGDNREIRRYRARHRQKQAKPKG